MCLGLHFLGLLFRLKATARSVGGSNGPVPPGSIRPLALQLEAALGFQNLLQVW